MPNEELPPETLMMNLQKRKRKKREHLPKIRMMEHQRRRGRNPRKTITPDRDLQAPMKKDSSLDMERMIPSSQRQLMATPEECILVRDLQPQMKTDIEDSMAIKVTTGTAGPLLKMIMRTGTPEESIPVKGHQVQTDARSQAIGEGIPVPWKITPEPHPEMIMRRGSQEGSIPVWMATKRDKIVPVRDLPAPTILLQDVPPIPPVSDRQVLLFRCTRTPQDPRFLNSKGIRRKFQLPKHQSHSSALELPDHGLQSTLSWDLLRCSKVQPLLHNTRISIHQGLLFLKDVPHRINCQSLNLFLKLPHLHLQTMMKRCH